MDKTGQPKESEPEPELDQRLRTRKRVLENDDDEERDHNDGEEQDHNVAEGQAATKKVAKINCTSGKERQLGLTDPRSFDHAGALERINEDYLGPDPTYRDKDFKSSFKIPRTSFQRLKDDVLKSNIPFYQESDIKTNPSVEAKLLLPLKTCGYGISFIAFTDYFGMSLHQAHEACKEFEVTLLKLYVPERALGSDAEEEGDEERELIGHLLRWEEKSDEERELLGHLLLEKTFPTAENEV
eukprot:CAMPEP_0113510844 /NCGR_PEP_ID=MMETSP0014_2-20120614/38362_1 /TAXON_ID=2857 /ORGANISM="Nitzschia sp." /LENGTH=240 /DNA_ID=CAMNT_0000406841 /DNA_START=27 /DNA_END=746 /DNA_ORIENTATION=+ /assembly_acc=CAM_ASM_000159